MDFSVAWDAVQDLAHGFVAMLPRVLVGAAILVIMEYDIGIGMRDDIEQARRIILETLVAAEGVTPDPKADVIVVGIGASSIRLRARWWSESHIADVLIAQDKVLTTVVQRLGTAGIDIPHPTRQILFHDQTEVTDGDRRRPRRRRERRVRPDRVLAGAHCPP